MLPTTPSQGTPVKSAADKSAADKSAADKSAADESAADESAADKSAADKSAADKSADPLPFEAAMAAHAAAARRVPFKDTEVLCTYKCHLYTCKRMDLQTLFIHL